MTAQIADIFVYKERRYSLAATSNGPLYNPQILNLPLISHNTALWRAYRCVYSLRGDHLRLHELGLQLQGEAPTILGILPRSEAVLFDALYENMDHLLNYDGNVHIVDGFIPQLYTHMGFHQVWKYEEVLELTFQVGVLQKVIDRSAAMAGIRERILQEGDSDSGLKPGS